uniref:DNA-directed RNA polymerase subunit n=1 Tax=Amphilophus citrinellus TaxID=61819 RepID=A0A3Q0T295_AMPCI
MANFEHAEDSPKHVRLSGEIADVSAQNQTAEVPPVPGIAAGAVPLSIPSFAAASELLSAPYSCLVMNTYRRHIALPPVYLNKKKTGIKEELEAELLKFSQRMNGVPLAYDNIRIVGQLGDIYDDNGYIHVDVEANFIVFQPQKGQKLQGKVNKLGVSHVGCLVHGCFNASIPRPNLVSVETWRDAGPRIGADVEFHVTALDANTAGVLLIRGRLDRTRVQELLAMCESTGSSVPTDEQEPEDPEATQDASEDTPKKKKKKKKVKEQEAEEIPSIPACQQDSGVMPEPNGTTDEADGNEASEKKKKKKKKEKHAKEEEEMELSRVELHGSDSSGYMSDKPNKKRKRESGSDVTSAFSEDPNPTKKKKNSPSFKI